MSEKWKNLLASSRLVAKGLDESSDEQIQASIESLSANFRDMLSLLNNYLTMISKYSEEDSENADQERTKRVEITINCRQALRFTLCLLSIESTREMVQNQACLTYEMHKPLSKLINAHNKYKYNYDFMIKFIDFRSSDIITKLYYVDLKSLNACVTDRLSTKVS